MTAWQIIGRFAPFIRIAHHIPGRVRLKADAAVIDDPQLRQVGAEGLRAALATIRGVRAIHLNLLARSCVVDYDRNIIPDAAWADLLAGRSTPAADVLIGLARDKFREATNAEL